MVCRNPGHGWDTTSPTAAWGQQLTWSHHPLHSVKKRKSNFQRKSNFTLFTAQVIAKAQRGCGRSLVRPWKQTFGLRQFWCRWREYFDDLLNPTDTFSVEELKHHWGQGHWGSLMAGPLDEVFPEFLNTLAVVELSCWHTSAMLHGDLGWCLWNERLEW